MAHGLTRFHPFAELGSMDPFRGLDEVFSQSPAGSHLRSMDLMPRMDVSETEQGYLVKAEMPGVKKEDIKVNIDGKQISITAETADDSEQASGNMLLSERSKGQYYRSFSLPEAVDDAQANAEYHDGILVLSLPKKAGGTSRKLDIH